MFFWNKICGFIVIFLLNGPILNAQTIKTNNFLPPDKSVIKAISKPLFTFNNNLEKPEINNSSSFSIIAPNYYTQHFGIICKKELAIEKATKIPFRFRIGSLQQCNYLEGKK